MKLSESTALITGGGTGIGAGCALALAGEGCRVAVAGRRSEKLEEAAEQFVGEPAILTHSVDVADRSSVSALFDWATAQLGRIDILINNAGVNVPERSMEELTPENWDRIVGINLSGAYNCIRAVLPQMRERGDGLIINIVSTAGLRATLLGGVAYNASKFAMKALGLSVAQEVMELGIRVTNIYPGEVETPILDERPVQLTAEQRARILQPSDLADAVLMVASLPPRANVSELVIKPTTQAFA